MNFQAFFKKAARLARGFTLVELMIVIAIISILAVVAVPAYNNYATKSKFTEVVLATAPTKTGISTCAVSGDCISNNQIVLAIAGSSVAASTAVDFSGDNTASASFAAAYVFRMLLAEKFGVAPAQAAINANNVATTNWGQPAWIGTDPSDSTLVCLTFGAGCASSGQSVPKSSFTTAYAQCPDATPQPTCVPTTYPISVTTPASTTPNQQTQYLSCVGPGAGCSPGTKYVASVTFDINGVITGTATATSGLNSETFVLMPSYSSGRVDWSASGTCKTRASGALC